MDDMKYSGYPGSEFPKQCGVGFGGHGQYGTYESCKTYDHAHANHVDYDPSIVTCGMPPQRPRVSSCKQPDVIKSERCGVETFTGEGGCQTSPDWWSQKSCMMPPQHCGASQCKLSDAENPGCATDPKFWGEISCHMPPKHCGGRPCGLNLADVPGVENYDGTVGASGDVYPGAMPASCGLEPVNLPDVSDCAAELNLRHDPGCSCTNCMAPYSMPYTPGPGCGKPWCRCKSCTGSCGGGAGGAARPKVNLTNPLSQMQGMFGKHTSLANVIIALAAALLTYFLLTRIRK